MINYVGAKAVPVPLRKEFGFRLDAGELADSINDRTKLIILNSPQNPPGGVLENRYKRLTNFSTSFREASSIGRTG